MILYSNLQMAFSIFMRTTDISVTALILRAGQANHVALTTICTEDRHKMAKNSFVVLLVASSKNIAISHKTWWAGITFQTELTKGERNLFHQVMLLKSLPKEMLFCCLLSFSSCCRRKAFRGIYSLFSSLFLELFCPQSIDAKGIHRKTSNFLSFLSFYEFS